MYRVEYASERIKKVLDKLESKKRRQVISDIDKKLRHYSWRTPGVKHMKGVGPLHRLRCGDFRVIFTVEERTIRVISISDRKDAY